jgi:hypothetical protein
LNKPNVNKKCVYHCDVLKNGTYGSVEQQIQGDNIKQESKEKGLFGRESRDATNSYVSPER